MDLEQIKKEKSLCEYEIKAMLNSFSQKTGLWLKEINILLLTDINQGHRVVKDVEIKVEIP